MFFFCVIKKMLNHDADHQFIFKLSMIIPIVLPLMLCSGENPYKVLFWILLLEIIFLYLCAKYVLAERGIQILKGVYLLKRNQATELNIYNRDDVNLLRINVAKANNELVNLTTIDLDDKIYDNVTGGNKE